MLYEELKTNVKNLGFDTIESFARYIGVTPQDILVWEENDDIPYTVSLIVHLLIKSEGFFKMYEKLFFKSFINFSLPKFIGSAKIQS